MIKFVLKVGFVLALYASAAAATCCQCGAGGVEVGGIIQIVPTCGPPNGAGQCGTGSDGLPCELIQLETVKCSGGTGVCTAIDGAFAPLYTGTSNLYRIEGERGIFKRARWRFTRFAPRR